MRLSELKTGEKGVIVKVLGHGGFRKRIVEMGFIKGKTVEVLLNAPLKDPVKYKVMGYEISLRRQEADMIEVISEQEAREHNVQPGYHKGLEEDIRLTEEEMRNLARDKRRTINVALVGNPNCGKTSLFNIASGAHEHVGNYSGVTVDAKEGASNLERNLYLTTQLIDMNVRMVVALNMYDELEASGNTLDYVKLGELFGVPMLPTVSRTGRGVEKLFHILITLYEGGDFLDKKGQVRAEILEDFREWHKEYVPDHAFGTHQEEEEHPRGFFRHIHINHGPELERSIDAVKLVISENENIRHKYSTRFLAIKLLENDKDLEGMVKGLPNGDKILEVRDREKQRIREVLNEDSEQAITDAKYGFISGALRETFVDNHQDKEHMTRVIDSIVTHRIWGFPVFFLFMFLMFEITFVLGAYPQGWIESLVAVISDFISNNMSEGPLKDLLIDGIIGGVGGVIVFLPNILILYLFISLMEDSGYMARAAFIMDKIMHKMGLHGKSFIPLIMGFGCNVPAVMASRTIENRKSRLVTILINPLMSCSARLPIYLLLVGVFFPQHASLVLLSIYSLGIILAVIMARLFSRFLVKGDDTPFVMELPPYRMPTSKAIFRHTWEKGAQYLRKMGGIIMVASIVIWALGYYPRPDASADLAQQQENSYIGRIGKAIEPVMEPLGFDWKLSIGILSGVGAKELVVSSLGVLYADDAEADQTTLAERLPITPLVAYGYMVFVLLYFPCIATLAAIRQEAGSWKWAAFAATYTTVLAWIMSFAVHQLGGLFV